MSELAKVGLTSSVLGAGFGMTAERFAKSYEKFAGRRPERMMDALRKKDPDAVDLANAAESAAFRNAEQTNQRMQQEILNRREQFDDDLIRLLQEQDQSSGGIYAGTGRLKVEPDVVGKGGDFVITGTDLCRRGDCQFSQCFQLFASNNSRPPRRGIGPLRRHLWN